MMEGDTLEAARKGSETLPDPRIRFFFDPIQQSGQAIAASLGNPREVAWDVYLFYPPDSVWEGRIPPGPEMYMHQLSDSWADQGRLFQDLELGKELHREMSIRIDRYKVGKVKE